MTIVTNYNKWNYDVRAPQMSVGVLSLRSKVIMSTHLYCESVVRRVLCPKFILHAMVFCHTFEL